MSLPPRYLGPEALIARSRRLVVIGDTQETALVERLVGLEQNAARRPPLLAELVRRAPDGVIHLGDLVTFGSAGAHWDRLDALLAPLRATTPIMPAVGNHDRMLFPTHGLAELRRRFPVFESTTWHRFRHAGIAFVALDTNLGLTERAAARAQREWLVHTLAEADADPEVRAVVAYWHHPPLSNSRIVRPSREAREVFVAALAKSRKAIAVFSGHCHAYERFALGDLACFVSGGGGGPRHRLETRPERVRAPDLYAHGAGGSIRFMHFLELAIEPERLVVSVVRMSDAGTFDIAETVALPYRA